ncbi:hypothetical protein MUK42_16561 [Musa troglodytarum]|uniref:Uncharacterized protein n=1 Tax=Musa troglodytarum TaxID=320322 RepID=A0A9E7IC58_9LILI|nr:hypothetical protein MUK42_16561 [Musa troglodytarum]
MPPRLLRLLRACKNTQPTTSRGRSSCRFCCRRRGDAELVQHHPSPPTPRGQSPSSHRLQGEMQGSYRPAHRRGERPAATASRPKAGGDAGDSAAPDLAEVRTPPSFSSSSVHQSGKRRSRGSPGTDLLRAQNLLLSPFSSRNAETERGEGGVP